MNAATALRRAVPAVRRCCRHRPARPQPPVAPTPLCRSGSFATWPALWLTPPWCSYSGAALVRCGSRALASLLRVAFSGCADPRSALLVAACPPACALLSHTPLPVRTAEIRRCPAPPIRCCNSNPLPQLQPAAAAKPVVHRPTHHAHAAAAAAAGQRLARPATQPAGPPGALAVQTCCSLRVLHAPGVLVPCSCRACNACHHNEPLFPHCRLPLCSLGLAGAPHGSMILTPACGGARAPVAAAAAAPAVQQRQGMAPRSCLRCWQVGSVGICSRD